MNNVTATVKTGNENEITQTDQKNRRTVNVTSSLNTDRQV